MTGAVLLLGGRSGIGLAIVEALVRDQPRPVVLARRSHGDADDEALCARLRGAGASEVRLVGLDAEQLGAHQALVEDVFAQTPVEYAVVAFGVLGDQELAWQDVAAAQRLMTVNATAATGVGVALAAAFRAQADRGGPQGTIVALSSVAGVRVRRSNFVYGASKQAMDSFYLNLAAAVTADGPRVLLVRPGAVDTQMVAGRPRVPLTVSPERVADVVRAEVARPWAAGHARVVHVPAVFGPLMGLARLVPSHIWQRLRN